MIPMRFDTSLDMPHSPDAVWAVLSDLSSYPEWNPMARRAEGTFELGRTLKLSLAGAPLPVPAKIRVLEPGRLLVWGGGLMPLLDVEHTFKLEPDGEGGTRFVHYEEFRGLLGPLFPRLAGLKEAHYHSYNQALMAHVAKRG